MCNAFKISAFRTFATPMIAFAVAISFIAAAFVPASAIAPNPVENALRLQESARAAFGVSTAEVKLPSVPAVPSSSAAQKSVPAATAPAQARAKASAPAAASAEVSLPAFAKPNNDIPGLRNFAKVSDALYRGEQPTAEGFAALKKMGVKTIVSLRAMHSDRSKLKGLGLNYYRIVFNTWHAEEEDVLKFLRIVNEPKYQPVFVHCMHGADRTGTMCAIYRVMNQGWDMKHAVEEMKNFGFHEMWVNLPRFLKDLDTKKLAEKLKKEPMPPVDLVQ